MSPTIRSKTKTHRPPTDPRHPHVVPTLAPQDLGDEMPDQPFVEGALDVIDPDLRYRMISEAAYRRYVERDYGDGYDMDDWLQAESDVDHLLLNRSGAGGGAAAD